MDTKVSTFDVRSKKNLAIAIQKVKYQQIKDNKNSVNITKTSYAEWLNRFSWTWWCTGTTGYALTLKSARRLMERYQSILARESVYTRIFWMAEPYELKNGYHLHFLLYTPHPKKVEFRYIYQMWQVASGLWKKDKKRGWVKGKEVVNDEGNIVNLKWNRITAENYIKDGGAGGYATKYIMKTGSEYDMISNLKLAV